MKGWIKLHRKIKTHWLWSDPIKLQRWLIMLFEVNYTEGKMLLGNKLITVKRGGSTNSLRTWSHLFGCGTKATLNFFEMLESDGMITRCTLGKGKHSTTLINITNYEEYQTGEETLTATLTTTQAQHKGHTIEEGKEGKELKNTITCFSFKDFWERYPNKTGRKPCEKKWQKIPEGERQKIKETLDDFILHKPFPEYNLPNPQTYLNQERWNDELKPQLSKVSNQLQTAKPLGKTNQLSYER